MNKKTLIIVLAILTLGIFIFLYNKNSSIKEKVDNILNKDNEKDASKAQASIQEDLMSDADKKYNEAREKYRTIAGDYPPASWSLNQINIWIDEWSDMNKYLSDYASLMAAMQQVSKADANIKNCSSKQEAKILYNNAVEEYKVYKEKYTAYQELVRICKTYNISATDMGITSINNNTLAEINNAITKANELKEKYAIYSRIVTLCKQYGLYAKDMGITSFVTNTRSELENAETLAKQLEGLKKQYEELVNKCKITGTPITNYINNNTKWYQIKTNEYTYYLQLIQTQFKAWAHNKGIEYGKKVLANIKPTAGATFRNEPQSYPINTELMKEVADAFEKYNKASENEMYVGFLGLDVQDGTLWDGGDKGTRMPIYTTHLNDNWKRYSTLGQYISESISYHNNSGNKANTHLFNRSGHNILINYYNEGKKPFSD